MVNNKKKKGRRNNKKAMDTTRRIEAALAKANAVENPVEGLEPFLSFTSANTGKAISIEYAPSLPPELLQTCIALFEANMGEFYKSSKWGLNLKGKQAELCHSDARFLIATVQDEQSDEGDDKENTDKNMVGFAHYRYDVNDDDFPTEPVLYVYEIQISSEYQKCGLGRRIMSLLELMARKVEIPRVMLTCFYANEKAIRFYKQKCKYVVDETSPSQFSEIADYEILSKAVM